MKHLITIDSTDFIIETGFQIIKDETTGEPVYVDEEKKCAKYSVFVGNITTTHTDKWCDEIVQKATSVTLQARHILKLAEKINDLLSKEVTRVIQAGDEDDDLPF